MIIIRFDRTPVPKARARASKQGHYTPENTRYAESLLRADAIQHMGVMAPLEGPLDVRIDYHILPPASWSEKRKDEAYGTWISKRPDLDNYAKLTCDALNGVVWNDDGQIAQLLVLKKYSRTSFSIINARNL